MTHLTGYMAKPFTTVNAERSPLLNSKEKLVLLGKVVKLAGDELIALFKRR